MRILTVVGVCVLSGCSLLPDRSLDYQQASLLAPLQLPTGQEVRAIRPLYVIPDLPVSDTPQTVVVAGKGRSKHFVAPMPKPLVIAANTTSTVSPSTVIVKPQVVVDGNGHPVMHSTGDLLQVWDNINKALTTARISIVDRNQSLGLYFIDLVEDGKKVTYQLKLTRTSNDNVISLQKDDDTLAESALSQRTLANLLTHWPSE